MGLIDDLKMQWRNGGMVGWALGSLGVAGLGQWPALLLIAMVGATGVLLF